MVRPLKMAVLLLSIHPLLDQWLLHLQPTHMTKLLTNLLQAPANDCSSFGSEYLHYDSLSKVRGGDKGLASLVNNEPVCQTLSRV